MEKNNKRKDHRGAIDTANDQQRSYKRKKEAPTLKKPDNARFKLVVYFNDGNECTFYSIDKIYNYDQKKLIRDEWSGYMKLQRLVKKYRGKFSSVCIYVNVHPLAVLNYQFFECPGYIEKSTGYKYENPTIKFLDSGRCNVELLKYEK